jgi:putative membrane protein
MTSKDSATVDSRYIQQHLANERTYLAWIRTSIAIIGVGFIITNVHFTALSIEMSVADSVAKMIGLFSVFLGLLTIILATISYFKKGKAINEQTFRFSNRLISFLSLSIILIVLVFGIYFLMVWG